MEGIIEAQREAQGFWSPDLLLGVPMKENWGGWIKEMLHLGALFRAVGRR